MHRQKRNVIGNSVLEGKYGPYRLAYMEGTSGAVIMADTIEVNDLCSWATAAIETNANREFYV